MEEIKQQEANNFFKNIKQKQVDRLISAGFTEEQAEVILDIMQTKAFSGGFF